jgi:hypothetical protein
MAFINFKTCCNTLLAEGEIATKEECTIIDECGTPTPPAPTPDPPAPTPDPPAPTPDPCIIRVVTIDEELVCSNGEYPTADGYDMAFTNFQTCCSTLGYDADDNNNPCRIKDECGVLTDPPVPSPDVETYEPTTGSTPTVATEAVSDIVDMGPRL